MLPSEELLQSIDIIAQNAAKNGVKIYTAIVTAVVDNNTCSVRVNGKTHSNIAYYGDAPTVNKSYRVFCPNGSMNQAFIITGGGSSSGGGSTGTTDYNQLTNRPSINGTTLSGNQTSNQLGLYGTNNAPPYPVQSVNAKTGAVVLTQDDVGDGTTYVRTHNDFTDALKTQINTNEDNIAMAESDIDGLQTDVGTLKTNVTSLQTALTSKQDIIVGAASTITDDNLVADRALISNSSGKVAVSNVTSTELGYLDGVTSNVQTQLDKKLETAPVTSVNSKIGAVQLNASDVGALPDTTVIPSKTSQLDNDSGFITDVPIASTTQLGGVKVGTGLNVTQDGILSATGGGTADAVEWNNVLDKPTTIAGYGITDAKIENGTITLGDQSIKPFTADDNNMYVVTLTGNSDDTYEVDKYFDDIYNAVENKKNVYLYNSNKQIYYNLVQATLSAVIFQNTIRGQADFFAITVYESIQHSIIIFEQTARKVNTISASSTATQYPSAKAVWDLVSNLSSGTEIVTSLSQPTGQSAGDYWYHITEIVEL